MDASTDSNAQKVLESGDFSRKIAPSADSVGDINFHVFTVEDIIDPEKAFDFYDFEKACDGTIEELFDCDNDELPVAISPIEPSMTHTPVLTSDKFVLLQDNPKRPGTASHLRYEMYKSANTKAEFIMFGGTSADFLWDQKHGYITAHDAVDTMDTGLSGSTIDLYSDGESDDGTGMTDNEFLAALAAKNPP